MPPPWIINSVLGSGGSKGYSSKSVCELTYIVMNVFPCFGLENSSLNFSKHFRYTLYILSGEIVVFVFLTIAIRMSR